MGVSRILENIPMTERDHRRDDRDRTDRPSEEDELGSHHRKQKPENGDPERDGENSTIEMKRVRDHVHCVPEDRNRVFFGDFCRLVLALDERIDLLWEMERRRRWG